MPELPEMEHYRRMLSARIVPRTIDSIEIGREKSLNVPADEFKAEVLGKRVVEVRRRAKHLLFRLEGNRENEREPMHRGGLQRGTRLWPGASGDRPASSSRVLLLHLMLGGWMFYGKEEEKPDRTVQVRLGFGENSVYFIGLRLGYLHLLDDEGIEARLAKLGPEPLDPGFAPDHLIAAAGRKHGMLKAVLTDQTVISGIGSCYSDEICFSAGILPVRQANTLSEAEWGRLYRAMQSTLREALLYGGYMEHPFFRGDRVTGGYNERCKVYGRGGEPCLRCGSPIRQTEVSGRKCFFCEHCQV